MNAHKKDPFISGPLIGKCLIAIMIFWYIDKYIAPTWGSYIMAHAMPIQNPFAPAFSNPFSSYSNPLSRFINSFIP